MDTADLLDAFQVCPGQLTGHGDGTRECTEGRACLGYDRNHAGGHTSCRVLFAAGTCPICGVEGD